MAIENVKVTNHLKHVLHTPPQIIRQRQPDGQHKRDELGNPIGKILAKCDSFALQPGDNLVPKALWKLTSKTKPIKAYLAGQKKKDGKVIRKPSLTVSAVTDDKAKKGDA